MRGAHLSPSQFEGSSEKLLIKDSFDMSPKLYSDGNRGAFYGGGGGGTFSSSSGRPSPCSTPTPPPYSRNRTMSPIKTLPSQVKSDLKKEITNYNFNQSLHKNAIFGLSALFLRPKGQK